MQQLRFIPSQPERLLGVDPLRQCSDGVSGRMELGAWSTGPDGRVSLGTLGVFADEVLGYALMASLPQGSWSISTEIWLDLVTDLPAPGSAITGHSRPASPGSLAVGELCGPDGRPVVLCRQRGRSVVPPADGESSGGATSRAADMETLLGLRAVGDGWVLPTRPDLLNPTGMLHGGISLAASEVVATRSRVEAGSDLRTSSVHIVHTRGVPVGSDVLFRPETRYAGRSLWVTEVAGTVGGRVSTLTTVTAEA